MYRIYCISSKTVDITEITSSISWSDSIDTLGTKLSFDVPKKLATIKLGDKILMIKDFNKKEIFRGVVIESSDDGINICLQAYDYGFYLNKSKILIQFNSVEADEAIRKVCEKQNISLKDVPQMGQRISKIYKDKTAAEIIKDILNQVTDETGDDYRMEMDGGSLIISKREELIVNTRVKLASNLASSDYRDLIGDVSREQSLEEMRNSILVCSDNEKEMRTLSLARDPAGINHYGLLQEIISVDEKDESKAHSIANNKLKELNKVSDTLEVKCIGDENLKAARTIELSLDDFDLDGKYLIKSSKHTYSNNFHKVSLSLEVI